MTIAISVERCEMNKHLCQRKILYLDCHLRKDLFSFKRSREAVLPKNFGAMSNISPTRGMKFSKTTYFLLQSVHLISVTIIFLNDSLFGERNHSKSRYLHEIVLKLQMLCPLIKERPGIITQ